jgi:hypothetical protein
MARTATKSALALAHIAVTTSNRLLTQIQRESKMQAKTRTAAQVRRKGARKYQRGPAAIGN